MIDFKPDHYPCLPLFILNSRGKILFASESARRRWNCDFSSGDLNFLELFEHAYHDRLKNLMDKIIQANSGQGLGCDAEMRNDNQKLYVCMGYLQDKGQITAVVAERMPLQGEKNPGIGQLIKGVQKLLSGPEPAKLDQSIGRVLRLLGNSLGMERGFALFLRYDGNSVRGMQWPDGAGKHVKLDLKKVSPDNLIGWIKQAVKLKTSSMHEAAYIGPGRFLGLAWGKPLLAAPVSFGKRTLGLIAFERPKERLSYAFDEKKLMAYAAALVAGALERHRLYNFFKYYQDIFQKFLNHEQDMVFLKDKGLKYLMVNDSLARFLGRTREEIVGKTDYQLMDYIYANNLRLSDTEALKSKGVVEGLERIVQNIYQIRKFRLRMPAGDMGVGGYIRNITNESSMAGRLDESEVKYKLIIDNQTELINKVSCEGKLIFVSPSYCRFYKKNEQELLGKDFIELVCPSQRESALAAFQQAQKPPYISYSLQHIIDDGQKRWVSWINKGVLGRDGKLLHIIGSGRDVTEHKNIEKEKDYLIVHDPLTTLYSRSYLIEELNRMELKKEYPITLILGDINGLKLVNTSYGQKEGDKIIASVGRMIKSVLRKGEIVARWGGDEFAVLLSITESKQAKPIIKRIKACLSEMKFIVPVSMSFAVSSKKKSSDKINLIKNAEDKLLKKKLFEKSSYYSSIITSLEKALQERDYETEEHVRRMKKYSLELGKRLGLGDDQLNDLMLAVTLHDIGKISIPDNIVLKPGKLDKKEWNIMKKHSEIGFRILNSSPNLKHISKAVLHHHEGWDGNGYPHGLKGTKIPLVSRIISVLDAFDAMTHDRPYKNAITRQQAVQELKKFSGRQFDPFIVENFLKILDG